MVTESQLCVIWDITKTKRDPHEIPSYLPYPQKCRDSSHMMPSGKGERISVKF